MGNNPFTDNRQKMFIQIDESTGLCPWGYESIGVCHMCLDMDIFLSLYTFYRKLILIGEPTWQVHTRKNVYDEFCKYHM